MTPQRAYLEKLASRTVLSKVAGIPGLGMVAGAIPRAVAAVTEGTGNLAFKGLGKVVGVGTGAAGHIAENTGRSIVDTIARHPKGALTAGVLGGGLLYRHVGPQGGALQTVNGLVNFAPFAVEDVAHESLDPFGAKATEAGHGWTQRTQGILNQPIKVNNPLEQTRPPNVYVPPVPGVAG